MCEIAAEKDPEGAADGDRREKQPMARARLRGGK
jgi:hypothetical protein